MASTATAACANAPERSLRPAVRGADAPRVVVAGSDRLVANAGLSGDTQFAVADLRSGKLLETRRANAAVPPASVAKAVTALYAMEQLGENFTFVTLLLGSGAVQNGILQGDLTLVGGGDPTLDTDQLAGMAAALKAKGITGISGRLNVYGGALPAIPYIDRDQPDYLGYNPTIGGLNANFNRVHFEWRRGADGYRVTMDARGKNYVPQIRTSVMDIVNRDLPVYAYSKRGGVDRWSVSRAALGGGGARWLPVRNPALYAGDVLRGVAAAQGVSLPAAREVTSIPQGSVLAQHRSPPLRDMARDMLLFSTNITAEVLGLRASNRDDLRASARAMSDWANRKYGTSLKLVDHSGLGDTSRVSAGDMVKVMVGAKTGPLPQIMKDIRMRDANNKVIAGHPVKVQAKTGTLNFVSALSGYLTAADGRELAFAMFVTDVSRRAAIPKAQREAPRGAKSWNKGAKALQQKLLQRWGVAYPR
ncbi:D-alanyl-D-alanine carboxypeptidase/D-alanyl-D-alanine-endopeptidase [Nereida sp. MMG025]|uniref:D-alanyl-D-alanine carboxypeptidase/D-alanyl-D-alanine-endopeptidase n=1 Tax=Nereida sp. MMG025 TaxID=2909981 RepID=UPI001F366DE3|nr:D-alanyl-D-alanine carboxypeptidase [Nereida sp. MMG025]